MIYLDDTRPGGCSLAAISMKRFTQKNQREKKIFPRFWLVRGTGEDLTNEKTVKEMKNKKEVTWHQEDSLSTA